MIFLDMLKALTVSDRILVNNIESQNTADPIVLRFHYNFRIQITLLTQTASFLSQY